MKLNEKQFIKDVQKLHKAKLEYETPEEQAAFMAGVIWQQNQQFKEMGF